jgi:hypothetical protein
MAGMAQSVRLADVHIGRVQRLREENIGHTLPRVNYEWMIERLTHLEDQCSAWFNRGPGDEWSESPSPALEAVERNIMVALPTAQKVLRLLSPALAMQLEYEHSLEHIDWVRFLGQVRAVVRQGVGIARDAQEVEANLAPDSPLLLANRFHSHVWGAAAPLWSTGAYRIAVGAAATALSTHIATRCGSTLTDRALVEQVFGPKPPPANQVRLHVAGDMATDTWKSRQTGLHTVAIGAFAGIRNIAAHTTEEWPEQIALEMLAVLSTVARWADDTVLVVGVSAP